MNTRKGIAFTSVLLSFIFFLTSCSVQKRIGKNAKNNLVHNNHLTNAHIGISIYDPLADKFLYNYQGEKYFVPASNTKIFTCYAALKYLGDSLAGINYKEEDTAIYLFPTGDPSLLHKDFRQHLVIDFLRQIKKPVYLSDRSWKTEAFGSGWAWNDYNQEYMAERSPLPVYGNTIRWIQERTTPENMDSMAFDQSLSIYSLPEVNWKVRFNTDVSRKSFFVQRNKYENIYEITEGKEIKIEQEVPFVTNTVQAAIELLRDTVNTNISLAPWPVSHQVVKQGPLQTVFSQPRDTLLKLMMHRSDNFFAEQLLLMASNKQFGVMDDDSIISYLLNNALSILPHKPRWVDGSGLSRYNLFTPQSFVAILNQMKNEFSLDRLKVIFPTPGTGTLTSYPKSDSDFIFAKTGTLTGVVGLSGFLYTRKNKLLIFSILVNNHRTSAVEVRKSIQAFLSSVRKSL